jgi:serine phosphatase RsbU (regulator of sigma subunit)
MPHLIDGSLLIVAGDVTGKGLKAGMLVALLVGATRTATDWTSDPEVILRTLNERLLGRGDAHATCLALNIKEDGQATLANAGHMPPYLNGEALAMDGALPLGMMEGTEFSVMRFRLAEGDRLMLLSDGIVEAKDEDGQLFGFERVQELLRRGKSASEVAGAAQKVRARRRHQCDCSDPNRCAGTGVCIGTASLTLPVIAGAGKSSHSV